MAKKVILSKNYEIDALNFAQSYCDANKIKLTPKKTKELVKMFCDELLGSISPVADDFIKRNPTTPKVTSKIIDGDGQDKAGLKLLDRIAEQFDHLNEQEVTQFRNQYVGAIMSIVNLLFTYKLQDLGIKVKGKDSSLAYKAKEEVNSPKELKEYIFTEGARLKHIVVLSMIMGVIDDLVFSNTDDFVDFVDNSIPSYGGTPFDEITKPSFKFSSKESENLNKLKEYWKYLKSQRTRNDVAVRVYEAVKNS